MKDVEGGTRTRRHQNILLHPGLATGEDGGKHEWWAQLRVRLVVQAGSQTVGRAASGGALALELPRATGIRPESPRIK